MEDYESQKDIDELVKSVAEQLDAGIPRQDIINGLSDAGLGSVEVEQFVSNIESLRYEARKQAGTKDLGCGFGLLLVGAGITFATWAFAEAGGSYWVMWGAMAFGMFYMLRGLYRKVTSTTDAGIRLRWIFGGIILIGGIVGGGIAINNVMTSSEMTPQMTPPSESFIVWEDNSFWEDETRSIFKAYGVVRNTHSEWSIKNVKIEVEAIDEANNVMKTYEVSVIPSTMPPGGTGAYSERLQLSYSCVSAEWIVVWEWVPP